MDAQDGAWIVSVAQSPHDTQSYSLYIKTPTHNLTLTRTTMEIVDLHSKLVEAYPHTPIPSFPIDSGATPPPKRRSTFLNTLSRLASPSAKSGKQSSQARKSQTSNVAPPSSFTSPLVSPKHEPNDPFAAFSDGGQPSSDPSLSQPVTNSTSTAIAAYLTTIANDSTLRLSKPWKRFVRVRTDDLESARIERAIKRVRSDLAAHVSPKVVKDTDEPKTPKADKDNRDIMGNHVVPHADTVIDPAAIALPGSPPKQDILPPAESLPDTTASAHEPAVPELPVDDETSSVIKPEEASVDETPTTTTTKDTTVPASATTATSNHKIHRSQSADPDKATRLSRAYVASAPSMDDGSQTESEASASISVPSRRRTRKKRSMSVDPNGKEAKKKSQRKVIVDDFEMLRVLGKGCAGKVLLVKYKSTGALYAMKAITKRHVLAHQELQHTLTEQAVLKKMAAESKDPFVVRLWWSFHDKENLFLIMDFHPGGDLATQLARWGRLGRDRARFYAAEIVEGVEGLHAAGVIYRDLKPENILIGSDGHIVLTDFGLSKEFARRTTSVTAPATPSGSRSEFYSSSGPGTSQPATPPWMKTDANGEMASGWPGPPLGHADSTSTFCGTAEYLAPEVIQGLPYSYEVDWWSFGTMLYEMLTGITPFWANNHSDMYVRVLQDELQFPDDRAVDPDTKSLIRGLLQRSPQLRICEPRIKKHPYFSMIDWSHVYYKRYIPPYIPPIDPANASDTQNFDDTFLEMEPVLDDPNDMPTDTDQTDAERTDGEDSATTPSQSRSSSIHPLENGDEEEQDVFDGYSYKGRHSVLIDDEEESESEEEYSTSEGEEELDLAHLRNIGMVPPQVVGKKEEKEEEEVAVEPKTPEARPQTLPETVEPSAEPEHPPKVPTVEEVKEPVAEPVVPEHPAPPAPIEEPQTPSTKPRRSKDLPAPRFAEQEETPAAPPKAVPRPVKAAKRREKSGVPALDKYLDEDTEAGERDEEDDDWDFIDAVDGEDRNGAKGTSLFARGVVDKYRLAVFRKASTPSSSRPNARTVSGMSKSSELSTDPTGSPSSQRRGRSALSFRKTPRQLLQPKSPPSTKSSATSKSLKSSTSVTLSAASPSSSGLLTASSSGATAAASPSLKSKESAVSVGNDSFSSGNSGNNETTVEDQPRTPVLDDHEKRGNKKLKKVKDNMFSIFTSQR